MGSDRYYDNNTEIQVTALGEGANLSLTCNTDLATCCRKSDTGGQSGIGEWYYPDGRMVPNQNAGEGFYRVRNAPQVVRLARRQSTSEISPLGSYCCHVPTTQGDMTFCAHIGKSCTEPQQASVFCSIKFIYSSSTCLLREA